MSTPAESPWSNGIVERHNAVLGKMTNNPPAMEDITYSELVSKHLCAMHEARKAFIEAKPNDKLRRALKTKTRVTTGISHDLGDLV